MKHSFLGVFSLELVDLSLFRQGENTRPAILFSLSLFLSAEWLLSELEELSVLFAVLDCLLKSAFTAFQVVAKTEEFLDLSECALAGEVEISL